MSNWDYTREESAPSRIAAGDYRVEIIAVEEKTSSTGNPMIVITIRPNGSNITIKNYIVRNQYFNRNATQFFDSFNVEEGNFNLITWVGAVGAARLKEDESGFLKVAWFIDKRRAEKLPAWVGEMPERQTVTTIGDMQELDGIDEDLPF